MRILLVPDQIWGDDSGAVSARVTISALLDAHYQVGAYTYEDPRHPQGRRFTNGFDYFPRLRSATIHHFWRGEIGAEFEKTVAAYRPDYVFFIGAATNKPYYFFKTCLNRNIPYVLLFYINDYYCQRTYAGLADGPCFKCIDGNYIYALTNGCQKQRPLVLHVAKGAAVLARLRKVFIRCHTALGYSDSQLSLYARYGLAPEKFIKGPVHFDRARISNVRSTKGDYFILCGQSTVEKGWHLMADIVRLCKDVSFKFVLPTKEVAASKIAEFRLKEFVDAGQIEIITDVLEHHELMSLVGGSRGVLVPSYYPTTGEFILLESLGLGKPVVVFRAGIHGEIIRTGENGLMAEIGDIQGYADHINSLISNEQLYDDISGGARLLFERMISSTGLANSLREAFPPRE